MFDLNAFLFGQSALKRSMGGKKKVWRNERYPIVWPKTLIKILRNFSADALHRRTS